MKRNILVICLSLIGVFACACGLTACGNKDETPALPAHEHRYERTHNESQHWLQCDVFGCDMPQKDRDNHTYGDWQIETAATETDEGEKKRACTICGYEQTIRLPSLSHKHSMTPTVAKAADCTHEGNTAYWYCSGCDTYFSDANGDTEIMLVDTVIHMTEHSFSQEKAEAQYLVSTADCLHRAVYYKSCSVCGEKGAETFEYGDLGAHHDSETWNKDETNHWHVCSVCGDKTDIAAHDFTNGDCVCGQNAIYNLLSVDGAATDGLHIDMLVDCNTNEVYLRDKVHISAGKWSLYSDIYGQNEITTKIATSSNGKLTNGDNYFYILLKDADGELVDTYTLRIYRSFSVSIHYHDVYGAVIHTESAYTGFDYTANYIPQMIGYTFNHWEKDGAHTTKFIPLTDVDLYADCTANNYTLTLDANGGQVATPTQSVTFDSGYTLPVPTRTGYTFMGWYDGFNKYDNMGTSKFANNATLTADWQINQYTVHIDQNIENGTVNGEGDYDYGEQITITAHPHLGYIFIGWYIGAVKISDKATYAFTVDATNLSIAAHFTISPEMDCFVFTSSASQCIIETIKDTSVKEIIVPDYVTTIESEAFAKCGSVEKMTLPFPGTNKNGTGIKYLFSKTHYMPADIVIYEVPSSLKEVVIRANAMSNSGFSGCSSSINVSVIIPDHTTDIPSRAFSRCNTVKKIEIPNTVTSIGEYAFAGCSSLISITIPNSVTNIGQGAFHDCSGLTSITIPNGVTSIGQDAFRGCSSLTSITIPNSVTSIGEYAFYDCSSLVSITIPNRVTSIGEYAFYDCSSLVSITIPNSVTSIGEYAFCGCSSLTSITIPNSVTSIGRFAVYSCGKITVYCEAESQPSDWHGWWNDNNCLVVWGYKEETNVDNADY